jgi:hypothetical protein
MVVCLSAMLVACGGGDDAGDGGDGGNGGIGSRVHRYQELATATATADFRAQLNAQGTLGYRYISEVGYNGGTRALFVNDASVAYTYEVLPAQVTVADFVSQVAAQGVRGFRYTGNDARGVVYRKVTNATETFTVEKEDSTATGGLTSAAFLAQVNARGANGFRLSAELVLGGTYFNLYEKSSVGARKYEARLDNLPTTESALQNLFDGNGQAGFRMRTVHGFADGNLWLFERDTSQSATFRYFIDSAVASAAALVTQANGQGASGRGLEGQLILVNGGVARDLYFLASANCTGPLCDVRGPFGY